MDHDARAEADMNRAVDEMLQGMEKSPLPKKRTFRVSFDGEKRLPVYIDAHSLTVDAGVLLFIDYMAASIMHVHRGFAPGTWQEFEEVFTTGQTIERIN